MTEGPRHAAALDPLLEKLVVRGIITRERAERIDRECGSLAARVVDDGLRTSTATRIIEELVEAEAAISFADDDDVERTMTEILRALAEDPRR